MTAIPIAFLLWEDTALPVAIVSLPLWPVKV